METKYYKYPRTPHADYSKPDPHGNDVVCKNQNHFFGKEVIVSTKLDGEGSSIYHDKYHARSIDSGYHPSRTWLKALHSAFSYNFPKDINRICGENLQAKHAIYYENLPTYFFVFGIYNKNNVCISWDDTIKICNDLNLHMVPVLYRGIWDEEKVRACYTGRTIINGVDCGEQEGFVCRSAGEFNYADFAMNSYKFVRPGHVPGDGEHWSKTGYMPNKLIKV